MAKITEDKTLTPAEQTRLGEFVQEVWTTSYWDKEQLMGRLGEDAEVCAEILGLKLLKPYEIDLGYDDDTVPE